MRQSWLSLSKPTAFDKLRLRFPRNIEKLQPVKVKPVADERYLLHLCRYIHANPVRHGLTRSLDDWLYTNYPEWIETRLVALVDRDFIKTYFPTPDAYRQFVLEYLQNRRHPDEMAYLDEW